MNKPGTSYLDVWLSSRSFVIDTTAPLAGDTLLAPSECCLFKVITLASSFKVFFAIFRIDILCHLPYLKNIVFRDTGYYPRIISAPTKVCNLRNAQYFFERGRLRLFLSKTASLCFLLQYLGGVATVNEQEFRRSIISILCVLLLADSRKIPHIYAPVG